MTPPGTRRRQVLLAALLLAGPAGCAQPSGSPTAPHPATGRATPDPATGPAGGGASPGAPQPPAPDGDPLREGIVALERSSGSRIGVVLTPVGAHRPAWHAGSLVIGPAWSTAKVPVAVAALQAHRVPADSDLLVRAITHSDNAAADQLFAALGPPQRAAALTQQVVRRDGDRTTTVPASRERAGFSIFGQTAWALQPQAVFAARLPCHADAAPVWRLMGRVAPDQRWGLGTLPGARFKGGWGPTPSGGYLVRQMGVVTLPAHVVDGRRVPAQQVAVALAVDRTDFSHGTRLASQLTRLLAARAPQLPSGRC